MSTVAHPSPASVGPLAATSEPIEAPHELLGLSPMERDPVRIVEAAQIRLRLLRQGSELGVRRHLTALIKQARNQMVRSVIQSSRARASAPSGPQ
jgi:hypothetical protein